MTDDFHDRKTYLDRYGEHSARLQNWIGAYGAGLATMLAYQFRTAVNDAREIVRTASPTTDPAFFNMKFHIEWMHETLARSFELIAFALGVQIFLLFLNKASQFALAHTPDAAKDWSRFDRAANWFSSIFAFDAVCDLTSVVLLGFATYYGIEALGLIA